MKNIAPFLCSIYLLILQSVQYYFKILPSGQSTLLMSFFERLQIGQSWWEDYDLPDGTLCVLLFWQSDPTEYWDERPAWISWKRKCEISWSECIAYLSPSVLDWMCSHWRQTLYCYCRAVWYCQWEIMTKRLWKHPDTHLKEAIWWHISIIYGMCTSVFYINLNMICWTICLKRSISNTLCSVYTNINQTLKNSIIYCA